jgi:hypothetical protein
MSISLVLKGRRKWLSLAVAAVLILAGAIVYYVFYHFVVRVRAADHLWQRISSLRGTKKADVDVRVRDLFGDEVTGICFIVNGHQPSETLRGDQSLFSMIDRESRLDRLSKYDPWGWNIYIIFPKAIKRIHIAYGSTLQILPHDEIDTCLDPASMISLSGREIEGQYFQKISLSHPSK